MRYQLRFQANGALIEQCETIKDAKKQMARLEKEDKRNGDYNSDTYEIYDSKTESIIEGYNC